MVINLIKLYQIKIENYIQIKQYVTIIELRQDDKLDIDFLEIENKEIKPSQIYNEKNKSIYLLHYPQGINIEMSNAVINCFYEDEINFSHYCAGTMESSG